MIISRYMMRAEISAMYPNAASIYAARRSRRQLSARTRARRARRRREAPMLRRRFLDGRLQARRHAYRAMRHISIRTISARHARSRAHAPAEAGRSARTGRATTVYFAYFARDGRRRPQTRRHDIGFPYATAVSPRLRRHAASASRPPACRASAEDGGSHARAYIFATHFIRPPAIF